MRPTESTRALPLAFVVLLGVLLLARGVTAWWEREHPPEVREHVGWRPQAEAQEVAARSGRPILYNFTADWCPPCKRMKAGVFASHDRALLINAMYLPVRVLDRQREEGRNPAEVDSLQGHFEIRAFPTLVAATADGRELGRVTGYRGAEDVMDSLNTFARRASRRRDVVPDSALVVPLGT